MIDVVLTRCAWLLRLLWRSDRGTSTVEFAIMTPVLCFSVLTAVDLGTALTERISMSHIVRSAAQVAMEDPGPIKVEAVMKSTASRNFVLEDASGTEIQTDHDPISLSASRFCGCPDQPETQVSCSTICTGTVPTFIYYRMSAAKDYSGLIVPSIPLEASAQVQVR